MTSPDAMRASDGDREKVVQALQEQVGEGRLTLEEFEQRSTAVYEAKTVGELRKLLSDLPVDVFPQAAPPFAMGAAWGPYPMPAVPPWQQQRIARAGGRPNPVAFVVLAFLLFAAVGSALTVAPYIVPLIVLGFIMLRMGARGGRGGRRYPPYGRPPYGR